MVQPRIDFSSAHVFALEDSMPTSRASIALLLLVLFTAGLSFGQTFNGTILGNVQDSSGAMAAGARVTVIQPDTNLRRTITTDKEGYFEFPLLPPGVYRMEAELAGFKKFVRDDLHLQISQKMEVPVQMELGS